MLNFNYNIIGALGKSGIGAGPDIQPTTTTTTTTTSTTTTTTTVGPISVRTDPYSASLVYAVPGALFDGLGQTSFRSDISSYIRGEGTSIPDSSLPLTSSFTGSASGSFTPYSGSTKWTGYPTSMAITGAICIEANPATLTQFRMPTGDFTIETWVSYATSSINTGTEGSPVPNGQNATVYYNYNKGIGFLSNGVAFGNPGVRFLISTNTGADIYFDSAILPRSASAWYHIAGQRSGSLFSSLYSGSAVQSFTYAGTLGTGSAPANPMWIFGTPTDNFYQMYYQDTRFYKGVAKYSNQTSGSTYTMPDSMIIA